MSMGERLLGSAEFELVRQFELQVHRRANGLASGEQRSPALGGGIEFADYREYRDGDDVRQVDWTVFLRLRKLLVKLSAEEKDLTLMVILDNSRSMNFGTPDKFRLARQIAAILAGIALKTGNAAGILCWGKDLQELVRPLRGQRNLEWISQSLQSLSMVQNVDTVRCMRQFAARYGRRCMTVLISDLLYEEWSETLSTLGASECDCHVIQVLAPEERDPGQQGEVTFVDMEDDTELPLHLDSPTLEAYRGELTEFLAEVTGQCRRTGIRHSLVSSDKALGRVFHEDLSRGGLVC